MQYGTEFVDAALINLVSALSTSIAQIDAKLAADLIQVPLVSYYTNLRTEMIDKRSSLMAVLNGTAIAPPNP